MVQVTESCINTMRTETMCNSDSNWFDGLEGDLNEGTAAPESKSLNGMFETASDAARYIRAGKATITLVSMKSGKRFTYKITAAKDQETGKITDTLFVGLLTGADNNTSYSYMGRISRDVFWAGRKVPKPSDVSKDAPSTVAFSWAWRQLLQGKLPEQLEVWHEGSCGRCGRKLTVPESIKSGFGPECINKIGGLA